MRFLSPGPAGQPVKQLQLGYADFFPEYFSLAEKPPAEFCLSPDGNTESISIDLLQKKGRVLPPQQGMESAAPPHGTANPEQRVGALNLPPGPEPSPLPLPHYLRKGHPS